MKKIFSLFILLLFCSITLFACNKDKVEEKFKVTFDTNGGSQIAEIVDLSYNSFISEPTNPTKEGKIFDGWYFDKECKGNKVIFRNYRITKDIILYAKWK